MVLQRWALISRQVSGSDYNLWMQSGKFVAGAGRLFHVTSIRLKDVIVHYTISDRNLQKSLVRNIRIVFVETALLN